MKLKVRSFRLKANKPIAFLHEKDANLLNVHAGERIKIFSNGNTRKAIVDVVSGFLRAGEIALSHQVIAGLNLKKNSKVDIAPSPMPKGIEVLKHKLKCESYTKTQLKKIILDIVQDSLTEAEIAYFISGVNYCGMSLKETQYLTESIVETGKTITWKSNKIADKHSIGGVPGNRTTPIVIAICAATGILMPKTSSRAITSAAGTADVIESIAKINFSTEKLKSIVKKTNAILAWGGSLGLAPADDKLIRVEKILSIDPKPQLLASILAKKLSVGSKYVLIDIPYGPGAKVTKVEAKSLEKDFVKLGKMLGLKITVVLTDGSQPIGNGIGPILEIQDVLRVLKNENPPKDLMEKSLMLSGKVMEMVGKTKKGAGKKKAKEILKSGKAFEKFAEIIKAQSGSLKNLKKAKLSHKIVSPKSGKISAIDNKLISHIARLAGCPVDKAAGIYLFKHCSNRVKKGEPLAIIYSESKHKMSEAKNKFIESKPYKII